jgi:hypothetical protein
MHSRRPTPGAAQYAETRPPRSKPADPCSSATKPACHHICCIALWTPCAASFSVAHICLIYVAIKWWS